MRMAGLMIVFKKILFSLFIVSCEILLDLKIVHFYGSTLFELVKLVKKIQLQYFHIELSRKQHEILWLDGCCSLDSFLLAKWCFFMIILPFRLLSFRWLHFFLVSVFLDSMGACSSAEETRRESIHSTLFIMC